METDRALQSLHTGYPGEIGTQIGYGGEARVYEMTGGRVLRLHHSPPAHPLSVLSALYDEMRTPALPFALPQIIEHGEVDGCEYSIDARIPGKPLIEVLLELRGDERRRALDAYLAAATMIASIEMRRPYFGEIIRDGAIQTTAWREFLHARVERSVALMHDDLRVDVPSFETALAETHRALGALPEPPHALVHGDYFPGNVLVGNDLTVTGVIDFGPLTVIGDPMMDVASAVIFLETTRRAFDPEDAAYLTQRLVDAHGEGAHEMLRAYRGFYAIRLSNSKPHDEHLYRWCLRSLAALAGR